jgi:hypothetical protein
MGTSSSRRQGAYFYDIEVILEGANSGRYFVKVLQMRRRVETGSQIPIDPQLRDEYGATPAEAFARIEAAVKKWQAGQKSYADA